MHAEFQHIIQNFENFSYFYLNKQNIPSRELKQAISDSLLHAGKRMRVLLCYFSGISFGLSIEHLQHLALAVEMIHCYSLIHDDMPSMDNSSMRRGKPSCHIKFGEANAILIGDSLHSMAFQVLSDMNNLTGQQLKKILSLVAIYSGAHGMISGQYFDINADTNYITLPQLKEIYANKTGKMILASIILPFHLSNFCKDIITEKNLIRVSLDFGLAFQIQDDIFDICKDFVLPRKNKKFIHVSKPTYPKYLDIKSITLILKKLMSNVIDCLQKLEIDDPKGLVSVCQYIINT